MTPEPDYDAVMVAHAAARLPVIVRRPGHPTRTGILVAWRPRYRGRRTYAARVQFGNPGAPLTLNLAQYDIEPT